MFSFLSLQALVLRLIFQTYVGLVGGIQILDIAWCFF